MKYLSLQQVEEAAAMLHPYNAFFGVTFLAAKQAELPVGKAIPFRMDAENKRFLQHHYRINPNSGWFFRVCRQSDLDKSWVKPDYASTGLQSINTRTFGDAFIHPRNSARWGWKIGYEEILASILRGRKLPLFCLAAWIYREKGWKEAVRRTDIVLRFVKQYTISKIERSLLFESEVESSLSEAEAFSPTPVRWQELQASFGRPPDVKPERGGALVFLETNCIGPAATFSMSLADRLTLITGDNGLGKSFLLEVAWFILARDWAGEKVLPDLRRRGKPASIKFLLSSSGGGRPQTIKYSPESFTWERPRQADSIPGLLIYARVDGSFAVWDPAAVAPIADSRTSQLSFTRDEAWDGRTGTIEGLVRDWSKWQSTPSRSPFEIFRRVLKTISPPDLGELVPGEPTRLPDDPREMPTIVHRYGTVPIKHESAGVRRILTLAYLVVWAWNEHKVHCEMSGGTIDTKMVMLIDEVEAHLHPKWQRVILPALLQVARDLDSSLDIQLIAATHSPHVLASCETFFNAERDKLFNLDLTADGEVQLSEREFVPRGHIDSWLTSPIFGFSHATNAPAEAVINEAIRLQKQRKPKKADVERLTKRLAEVLPVEDRFWTRWIFFAERFGVKI
jgi:AAA domain, putative AbiEii toxin, Type IV TA system